MLAVLGLQVQRPLVILLVDLGGLLVGLVWLAPPRQGAEQLLLGWRLPWARVHPAL